MDVNTIILSVFSSYLSEFFIALIYIKANLITETSQTVSVDMSNIKVEKQ